MKFDPSVLRFGPCLWVVALIYCSGMCMSFGDNELLYPEFENALENSENNPPTAVSSSAVFFSGSVGSYAVAGSNDAAVVPTADDSGITLEESSFGQYVARNVPYTGFSDALILEAQALLYPAPSQTRDQIEGGTAAFRYKPLLYSNDGEGGIGIDANQMDSWFGDPERSKVQDAILILKNAARRDPLNTKVRNALLDVYYDLGIAEVQYIKQNLASLAEWRLGFRVVPTGGFIIDQEIEVMNTILEQYRNAMNSYGALLNDRMSVNLIEEVDSSAPEGMPLGTFIFREEQPFRNQMAAEFVDDDGILKTVPDYDLETEDTTLNSDARVLFSGYKDYVFMASLLRDYVQSAAELATFYGMRGRIDNETDDRQTGMELIAEAQQQVFLNRLIIENLFPDYEPVPGDASGLLSTLNGIDVALGDLSHAQSFLIGISNVLGFDPDFLVLIQEFPDSTEGNQFDSYDAMIRWIRSTSTSPLTFAETTYQTAFDNYATYKGHADQVANQLSGIDGTYNDRYFEITGYTPDEEGSHLIEPREGSELWEVKRGIEQAENTVAKLTQLDLDIDEDLITAGDGVTTAQNRITTIDGAVSDYQGVIRKERNIMTTWSSIQAGTQAAYNTLNDASNAIASDPWTVKGVTAAGAITAAGVVNTAVQTTGEIVKGNAQKRLDLAAVTFQTALEKSSAELAVQQALADRNSLQREEATVALQLEDAKALRTQEEGREASLLREIDRITVIREQSLESLQGRYYADPIHFLRSQNDMIKADNAFREAQRWLFYTARALEFKWNKDFVIQWLDKDWEISSLFKLRNFPELEEMVGAIEEFNRINLVGFNRESFVDRISLKDDILTPALTSDPDDGQRYDSLTGETISQLELFRRKLERNKDVDGNIIIRLNTFALQKRDGFFFLGPDYRSDGTVLSAGKYLDKIDWFKINAVTPEAETVRTATFDYGGTCYIRNRVPPCLVDEVALELPDEYRRFPFRYFLTLDNGATWQTRTSQQDTVKLVLSPESGEPEKGILNSDLENGFLKERSVATSDIVLTIPASNLDVSQLEDIEIYIKHLFASREVPECN